jgi:tripartite-type tricarboxylate transporter receptor subunit TctC
MRRSSVVVAALVAAAGASAHAQSYPSKPLRAVVGYPPGGIADVTARLVGQKLNEALGQPLVIENRPGASGAIASERVAKSPADGYTILVTVGAGAAQPGLRDKVTVDIERDLTPISLVVVGPYALVVHPSVPARNVKELIAIARSRAGKLNFSSSGVGGSAHLSGELFKVMAKVDMIHVPYKGSSDASTAIAGGQVDLGFPSLTGALPLMTAKKIRGLAVTTANATPLAPGLPSINESGLPGYVRNAWVGVLAPAGTPKDIVARLNAAITRGVNQPDTKEAFNREGLEPQSNTPEQFAAFIRNEVEQNQKLIRLTGASAQ